MKAISLFTYLIFVFTSWFAIPSYTQGVVGLPQTFYPVDSKIDAEKATSKLLFSGLVRYNKKGEIVPDLASEVIASDDHKNYIVRLRDDIYFTNGFPITTDDVIFTYSLKPEFNDIVIQKINSKLVEFRLPNELASFTELLSTGILSSEDNFKDKFKPISSGKFEVVSYKRVGDFVSSVKLKSRGFEGNRFEYVQINYYDDYEKVRQAAQIGEIDGFFDTKVYSSKIYTSKKLISKGRFIALYFNTKSQNGSKLELRKALYADTPRQNIVDKVFNGNALVYPKIYSGTDWYFDNVTTPAVSDQKFTDVTLKLAYPDDNQFEQVVNELITYWNENYGIKFEIKGVDLLDIEGVFKVINDYDAIIIGSEISPDPDQFAFWHSTQNTYPGLNVSNYSSIRADTALEEGRKFIEKDERKVHYNVLQETLTNDLPVITLYQPVLFLNTSKKFSFPRDYYYYTPIDQLSVFIVEEQDN